MRQLRLFARRMGLSTRSSEERRLRPILVSYRRQLEDRRSVVGSQAWIEAAGHLLVAAEDALEHERDPGTAWACYLAAAREEMAGMSEPQMSFEAAALRHEANEKLSGWRREAAQAALEMAGDAGVGLPDRIAALQRASLIRDEESQNRYFGLRELRKQLQSMGWILGFAILATLFAISRDPIDLSEPADSTRFDTWRLVLLFGMLGGTLSAIRSLTQERGRTRIPEQLTRGAITVFRPLMGAGAALASFALLGAGLVRLSPDSLGSALAVAFAAGFSERLIVSALGAVTPDRGDGARGGGVGVGEVPNAPPGPPMVP